MKKQIIIGFTIVLVTLSLALGGFVAAIESDDLSAQETIITGMVVQDGDTITLLAIDGFHCTITGQDLSNLVGKKVQATGKFIKEKDKSRFDVNKVIELPDKTVERHQPFEPNRQ